MPLFFLLHQEETGDKRSPDFKGCCTLSDVKFLSRNRSRYANCFYRGRCFVCNESPLHEKWAITNLRCFRKLQGFFAVLRWLLVPAISLPRIAQVRFIFFDRSTNPNSVSNARFYREYQLVLGSSTTRSIKYDFAEDRTISTFTAWIPVSTNFR